MRWIKLGLLFSPPEGLSWAASHAAVPTVDAREPRWRVYYSPRDARSRSQIGYFDVDVRDPTRILEVGREPVLTSGLPGTFDESAAIVSSLVTTPNEQVMFYVGWSLGVTVPFYAALGAALREGATFRRVSAAPVLARNPIDPYLMMSPHVMYDEGRWRMWYSSGTEWRVRGGQIEHRYHIKYAESFDGRVWNREGVVCIDYKADDEYAIGRPFVVKDPDRYRMWYCYRGRAYRIGYAESADGIHWTRRDDLAGIDVSDEGWDSEMLAYPCVVDRGGDRYMLYNGNGYGRTGIGLAVLDA